MSPKMSNFNIFKGCKGGKVRKVFEYTQKYSGCTNSKVDPYDPKNQNFCFPEGHKRVANTTVKKFYSVVAGEER